MFSYQVVEVCCDSMYKILSCSRLCLTSEEAVAWGPVSPQLGLVWMNCGREGVSLCVSVCIHSV